VSGSHIIARRQSVASQLGRKSRVASAHFHEDPAGALVEIVQLVEREILVECLLHQGVRERIPCLSYALSVAKQARRYRRVQQRQYCNLRLAGQGQKHVELELLAQHAGDPKYRLSLGWQALDTMPNHRAHTPRDLDRLALTPRAPRSTDLVKDSSLDEYLSGGFRKFEALCRDVRPVGGPST
jgi:hypothetical protein